MESRHIIGICVVVFILVIVGWRMWTPAPVIVGVYSTGTSDSGTYSKGTYDTGPTGTEAPVVIAPPSIAGSYKIVRGPGERAPPAGAPEVLIIEANASGGFKMYESTKPDRYELGTQTGSSIIFAPPPGNGGLGPGIKTVTQTTSGATLSVPGPDGFAVLIPLARI
jgi:hypothetical protein